MGEKSKNYKLKRFLAYYKPHMRLFILDMSCALMIALVDLGFPLVSRYALQNLLPQNLYAPFFVLAAGLVLLYVLRGGMQYIVDYWGHILGVKMEADMRRDLFSHLQKLSFSFYDKTRTGHLMSRVMNDLFEITELAHHGPEDLFISLITFIGAFIALLFIQWKLALVLFALVPALLFFTIRNRRRMSRASREVKESTAGINAGIESSISGIRVATAFSNEEYELEKFERGNRDFRKSKRHFYKAMGIYHSGMEFMTSIQYVMVIVVGGLLVMRGDMDATDIVTFTLFVSAFLQPIRRLTAFVEQYETGMAGFSRFVELMEVEPDIKDLPGAEAFGEVKGDIIIKDVSFSYDKGVKVLNGVNLDIKAGSRVALVGPSGGGKTTLCQLLPRFYDIDSGTITIDGRDIRQFTLASLREKIGIVQQDVFLFAGSIYDNILYGNVKASREEVEAAAKKAEIHDFVMSLEDGYDTMCGERGVMLSGGQKQRISIARIFLKNPPILILDEATSALDLETEHKIGQALDELSRGRTSLIIAHRLSTVRSADMIAFIDDEGIKEYGPHDELMAKEGYYYRLYQTQFLLDADKADLND
ncbi:MAG: ABC transporter ATP-binding protein [Christensenellales bacterium]|jgi:ATP-binding cassette subfamily B protein